MNNPKIIKISLDYLILLIKKLFFNLTYDMVFSLIKTTLGNSYQCLRQQISLICGTVHRISSK